MPLPLYTSICILLTVCLTWYTSSSVYLSLCASLSIHFSLYIHISICIPLSVYLSWYTYLSVYLYVYTSLCVPILIYLSLYNAAWCLHTSLCTCSKSPPPGHLPHVTLPLSHRRYNKSYAQRTHTSPCRPYNSFLTVNSFPHRNYEIE